MPASTSSGSSGSYTDEQAQDAVGTILTDTATIDFTYSDPTPSITADVKTNSISNSLLRQSSALSVVGNATNATANVGDITGTANQVMRVNSAGTALGFGQVNLASSSAVTGSLAEANGGTGQDNTTIGTGFVARTGSNTYVGRTISNGTGTTATNGNGSAGNPSINVTYGTSSNTATQGNDTRLPPTPTAAGKLLYDTGAAYAESAAGTAGQELRSGGAAAPTWGTAGGGVACFYLNTSQSFVSGGYVGIGGDGASTVNVNVTPWVVPADGVLSNLRVFGLALTSGATHIIIYKSSSAVSPTYSATALDATVAGGGFSGSDTTHTVSVSAGDLIVGYSSASWSANGATIQVMFTPN